MSYVHNQWYDMSCATLYILPNVYERIHTKFIYIVLRSNYFKFERSFHNLACLPCYGFTHWKIIA